MISMQTVSIEAKIFLESEFRQIVITLASLVGLFDAVFVCLFVCFVVLVEVP